MRYSCSSVQAHLVDASPRPSVLSYYENKEQLVRMLLFFISMIMMEVVMAFQAEGLEVVKVFQTKGLESLVERRFAH